MSVRTAELVSQAAIVAHLTLRALLDLVLVESVVFMARQVGHCISPLFFMVSIQIKLLLLNLSSNLKFR